jgi:hypothetical protein
MGSVADLDRQIQAARNECVFVEHFESLVDFVQDLSGNLLQASLQFRKGTSPLIVWDLDVADLEMDSDETKALLTL